MSTPKDYPALYHAHHMLRSQDLPFWLSLAAGSAGRVLELGCGTGRVAAELARAGIPVSALDNDASMLAYFREAYPLDRLPGLHIYQADMTNFDLEERFALILLPCNTYSTFHSSERKLILARVRNHLEPGGRFVVSVPNPTVLVGLPANSEPELEDEFQLDDSDVPVRVFSSWDRLDSQIRFIWHYEFFRGREIHRVSAAARHYLDPAARYLGEVHESGLQLEATWGDFEWAPFEEESTYLVICARRPETA